MLINAEWNRLHKACYSDLKLKELYDRDMTISEVLTRHDDLWTNVSSKDRIWVLTRQNVLTKNETVKWLNKLVNRAKQHAAAAAYAAAAAAAYAAAAYAAAAYAAAAYAAAADAADAAAAADAADAADAAAYAAAAADAADAADAAAYAAGDAARQKEYSFQISDALEILSQRV